jgi:hypothetical protein
MLMVAVSEFTALELFAASSRALAGDAGADVAGLAEPPADEELPADVALPEAPQPAARTVTAPIARVRSGTRVTRECTETSGLASGVTGRPAVVDRPPHDSTYGVRRKCRKWQRGGRVVGRFPVPALQAITLAVRMFTV